MVGAHHAHWVLGIWEEQKEQLCSTSTKYDFVEENDSSTPLSVGIFRCVENILVSFPIYSFEIYQLFINKYYSYR